MKQNAFPSDFNLSIKEYFANGNPLHRHNYFELIYVLSGRGIHNINENQFAYAKDDIFLLSPADSHSFTAHEQSIFCIIDFTPAYFNRNTIINNNKSEPHYFFKQLEYVFQNTTRLKGYIPLKENDKVFARILVERLVSEWSNKAFFRETILQNLVFLLLNIIAQYAAVFSLPETLEINRENKAYEMMVYLQHYVYDSELISLGALATQFNLSKDYVGAYFKGHTGKSIKQFVIDYKLELVKSRMQYSNFTIGQIADELNFTDESHLNKAFKKKYGMTAKQYQRQYYKSQGVEQENSLNI